MLRYTALDVRGRLLVALIGVRSSSLLTGLLILLFGLHYASAVRTDLLYAATTKSGGTFKVGYEPRLGCPGWSGALL